MFAQSERAARDACSLLGLGAHSRPRFPAHLAEVGAHGRWLARRANPEDRPRARDLNERPIRRTDIAGGAAGTAARVAHRAVIDDIGAAVRSEPHVGRAVETSRISGADKRLIAGIVACKVLKAQLKG